MMPQILNDKNEIVCFTFPTHILMITSMLLQAMSKNQQNSQIR